MYVLQTVKAYFLRVDIFASDTFKNAFKTYNPVQQNIIQTVLLMDGLSDKQLGPPNLIRLAKCAFLTSVHDNKLCKLGK